MIAVVGIGNPLHRDDNIGNIVSEKIGGIAAYTTPENMLAKLRKLKPNVIVFVDAVEFGGRVGEVGLFDIGEIADEMMTTHTIPVGVYSQFFPDVELKVIGIAVKDRDFGEGLSKELKEKLPQVVTSAKALLGSL